VSVLLREEKDADTLTLIYPFFSVSAATLNVTFPSSSVKVGKNIITIVQDHMGYEMEYGALPIGLVADDGK